MTDYSIESLGITGEIRFIDNYLEYFIGYLNKHQIGLYKNEYEIIQDSMKFFEDLLNNSSDNLSQNDLEDIPKTLNIMWTALTNLTEIYTLNNIHVAMEKPSSIIESKVNPLIEKDN